MVLVTFFLIQKSSINHELVKASNAWNFPGELGQRFPIVANNIIRELYISGREESTVPSVDTILYFLRKALEANFSIVSLNLTPCSANEKGNLYARVVDACYRLSDVRKNMPLHLLVYDSRLHQSFNSNLGSLMGELYSQAEFYGFSFDEPREHDFDRLSIWSRYFNNSQTDRWPGNKLFYVNLFGVPSEENYEQYVLRWIEIANPRVISFDNYAVWDDEHAKLYQNDIGADWAKDYFCNLEFFRQISQRTAIPFWTWILVHKHWSTYSQRYYRRATIADLHFQVYSALAYGAKGILYYNFWNPPQKFNENGWHEENGILSESGEETELYSPVAKLNAEVQTLGELLLDLEPIGVYHVTHEYPVSTQKEMHLEELYSPSSGTFRFKYGIKLVGWNSPPQLTEEEVKFKFVKNMTNKSAMIGLLRGKTDGGRYILVVNKNRHSNESIFVTIDGIKFPNANRKVRLRNVLTGEELNNHSQIEVDPVFSINLEPGNGILYQVVN